MNNTKIQTPWGRILLMHRLLWALHKTSLQIALGIAASIGGLIGVLVLSVASERELNEFSSWGSGPMIGIILSSIGISWFWTTYCLNHSVQRMVGATFSTIPLRLREKCAAIGLCLLEGYVAFVIVGCLMAILMTFCVEGFGALGMLADIYLSAWHSLGTLRSSVMNEIGVYFFLASCTCLGLIALLDITITIWSFTCFSGYIKAFFIRMVASYVSWQLIWFYCVVVVDSFSSWSMIDENNRNSTNLWLLSILLFALVALAVYRTFTYLRTIDR